jgi:hypothetical protein
MLSLNNTAVEKKCSPSVTFSRIFIIWVIIPNPFDILELMFF